MAAQRLGALEQQAWGGFIHAYSRIWRELEVGLTPLGMSLAEYEVLLLLDMAHPHGVRMSDLADQRMMTSGGFTRLADRLERRGLVQRRRSGADGRSIEALMTDEGRSVLRRARKLHHADLHRLFLDRLREDDLRALARIWTSLDPAFDRPPTGTDPPPTSPSADPTTAER